MNVVDVLQLRVRLDGVSQAISGMNAVAAGGDAAAAKLSKAGMAATGLAAAGMGIAFAALKSNSELTKVAVQLEALYGKARGGSLTSELRDMSMQTSQTFDELAGGMRQLANAGFKPSEIMPTMRDLANMSALGANFEGVARAVGQMKSNKVIFGEELNQLVDAGFALDLVMRKMGMTKKQMMGGSVSSDTFIKALHEANKELGDAGKQMLARDPLLAMRKSMAQITMGLAPTGVMFAKLLEPVVNTVGAIVNGFSRLNDSAGGAPAFLASLGLIAAALAKIGSLIMVTVVSGWTQTVGAIKAAVVWIQAAAAAEKVRAMWTGLSALAAGAVARDAKTMAIGGAIVLGTGIAAGVGIEWALARSRDVSSSAAAPVTPAERPIRRSSIENTYARLYGSAVG